MKMHKFREDNVLLYHEKQNPNIKNEEKASAEKLEKEPFFYFYSTEIYHDGNTDNNY
jgi:hypothetical protein